MLWPAGPRNCYPCLVQVVAVELEVRDVTGRQFVGYEWKHAWRYFAVGRGQHYIPSRGIPKVLYPADVGSSLSFIKELNCPTLIPGHDVRTGPVPVPAEFV